MLSRRQFLERTSLVALSPSVPAFLKRTARAGLKMPRNDRVMVIIQLDGGNDGINTVVPIGDESYAKHRKTLRLPAKQLIKIDDGAALHPSMGAMASLLDSGRLSIIQGAGYPNPDRSHFRSMPIWQTSRFEKDEMEVGWCGRAFDSNSVRGNPDSLFVGAEKLPLALRGNRSVASTLRLDEDVSLPHLLRSRDRMRPTLDDQTNRLQDFVQRAIADSYTTAELLAAKRSERSNAAYPKTKLARELQLIARLIESGMPPKVYYAIQSGYDTHANQLPAHARLLSEFAGGVKAFLDDLKAADLDERVVVMAFSEFGRRVNENGSRGTDHGTAGPMFVAGSKVNAGIVGNPPNLADLVDGDLKMQVDFRHVYATLLEDWLEMPAESALGGKFARLPLFNDLG